jgi:hypothetical protein
MGIKLKFSAFFYDVNIQGFEERENLFDGLLDNGVVTVLANMQGDVISLDTAFGLWRAGALQIEAEPNWDISLHVPEVVVFSSEVNSSNFNGIARVSDGKVVFFEDNGMVELDSLSGDKDLFFIYAWAQRKCGVFDEKGELVVPFEQDNNEGAKKAFVEYCEDKGK